MLYFYRNLVEISFEVETVGVTQQSNLRDSITYLRIINCEFDRDWDFVII